MSAPTPVPDPKPQPKTVLLVEDDESIRSLVRFNLELHGFEVVEASDGLEGLLLVDLHRPDVVILDLMMPDVDGAKMLAQLRGTPAGASVPVIIITGKAHVSPELRGLAGEGNLLVKPFDPDVLVERVRELVRE